MIDMSLVSSLAPFAAEPQLPPEVALVLQRIRLRGWRRAAWLDHLVHGAHAGNGSIPALRSGDAIFVDRDSPVAEAAWQRDHAADIERTLAAVETELASAGGRLTELQRIFGLAQLDVDILHCALAAAVDPALRQVYAYLQEGARVHATEELVARLFGYGRCLLWSAESPLRTWRLVAEHETGAGEPPALICDRQLRDWVLGQNDLHELLVGIAQVVAPEPPLSSWPVDEVVSFFVRSLAGDRAAASYATVVGPPGSGRRTFAAVVAAELGLPLLAIDFDLVDDEAWTDVYVAAQRQAYLDRTALVWCGQRLGQRVWPQVAAPFPVQFFVAEPGQTVAPPAHLPGFDLLLPQLAIEERQRLWRYHLPEAAGWPPHELDKLAARHQVAPGDIAAIGRNRPASAEQARQMLSTAQRSRLGHLAQRLDCPFTWQDLVVADNLRAALEDFAFEARDRTAFWEQAAARRLFPRGRGLIGLLSGPAGTGKTMAAQVIAADLGLDLFRVDLASVVSKYVGETSQNLERILSRAAQMDIVLFFDEADALFSKRTEVKDAHDRFANTDTDYLLQAIESYDGVALLATNKKANLDTAFLRRLRYVLEFAEPDAAQRLQIWRQIVGELAGAERLQALDDALQVLAAEVPLTGAQIKAAILSALFMARRQAVPLTLEDLLAGLNRELRKEGRALSDREVGSLRRHGR